MNDRNTTLFPCNKLPASEQGLMDFYCLQHLRCQPLESLYIQPPSEWTAHGPEGDIFEYPIQITVLGTQGEYVDLGVYAHPCLRVQQGPSPNRIWRKKWRRAPFLNYMRRDQTAVAAQILSLCDQFHCLQCLHHYYYESISALLHQDDMDYCNRTLQGFDQFRRWLAESDQKFQEQLDQIHQNLRQMQSPGNNTR